MAVMRPRNSGLESIATVRMQNESIDLTTPAAAFGKLFHQSACRPNSREPVANALAIASRVRHQTGRQITASHPGGRHVWFCYALEPLGLATPIDADGVDTDPPASTG